MTETQPKGFIYVGPDRPAHEGGGIQAYGQQFYKKKPVKADNPRVREKLAANPEFEQV